MTSRRFSRTTQALLAAIYLIVGAAGQSLYYWAESPTPAASVARGELASYVHDHGDGHWHRHVIHRPDTAAVNAADADNTPSAFARRGAAASPDSTPRHDHTTLLLAIAAEMELSLLAGWPSAAPHASSVRAAYACCLAHGWVCAGSLGPRGPPLGLCV